MRPSPAVPTGPRTVRCAIWSAAAWQQLEQGSPVFQTSAEKIVHAGPIGSGIALKLCNNFIQYTEFVAMAEALRLAESCGLSVEVLRAVGLCNGVVNEQMFICSSAVAMRCCKAEH